MELFRRFLVAIVGMIDSIIYELIAKVYNILIGIAGLNPFGNEMFANFANRVYVLLGLFMLFKVSFSLIKYIVNPDEFSDQTKGGKKMVINIIIVLILVITIPEVFNYAYKLQDLLLNGGNNGAGVLENLILGGGLTGEGTGEAIDRAQMGQTTKMLLFRSFYNVDESVDPDCAHADPMNTEDFVSKCATAFGEDADAGADDATRYALAYQNHSVYDLIFQASSQGDPMFMLKIGAGTDSRFVIDYSYIVSSIVGVITVLIFLGFTIDVAVRAVKLGFLQLISPIPIISYVDPNSAKSGLFNKWLKECGKTYIDLFVRLGAVYFAVLLISRIMSASSGLEGQPLIARVLIILGILMFAKQIPKLLGDLLGVQLDGNFSINPISKFREIPIAGAVGAGAFGLAGGAYAGFKAGGEVGKPIFGAALGGLTGARQAFGKVGLGGAKKGAEAPHSFGTSMNSVFKQMTNREMTNLNPVNMLSSRMVDSRYSAVKTAKQNAQTRLSSAQVAQEAAYNQMQQSSVALNGLSEPDRKAFLNKANYYADQARILDDRKATAAEKEQARINMERVKQEIKDTYNEENGFQAVAAHFNDRVAAQEANSLVASINKDIEDLTKEKTQLEVFGHIDPASTRDVDKLLGSYSTAPQDISLGEPITQAEYERRERERQQQNGQGQNGQGQNREQRNPEPRIRADINENGERQTPGGIILSGDVRRVDINENRSGNNGGPGSSNNNGQNNGGLGGPGNNGRNNNGPGNGRPGGRNNNGPGNGGPGGIIF